MFRSATLKLTLWYLAIVMAISLTFSGVLYHVVTGELQRGLNHEMARIGQQFPVFQGSPLLRPGSDYTTSAHRLVLRLIVLNLIVLAGAGFAGYWLARRTLEPIEAAHEQQKRFTADVSHELRTPLTALRMESEVALLQTKTSPAELRRTLQSNLEEVGKLEALINNLLRLTRLEADELQQTFVPLSSQALASAALERVSKLAAGRHVKLRQTVSDSSLFGDADSLTQLLVILLDNAIKYSPVGSTVSLNSQSAADRVSFEIIDHGSGIEPAALEHVFDRFYRADSSRTKSEGEGYGLGLSIAKMISDVHHGSVTLTSQLQRGTTATVSLPRSASDTKPA